MSVIIVASKNVTAQTIQTMKELIHPKAANPQMKVGGQPERMAININTNKVYVWNPRNGTVSAIDSNMGIHLLQGEGKGYDPSKNNFGSIAVDDKNNRVYVANEDSNTVYVIDGKNDTNIAEIPVGKNPSFILIPEYNPVNKIYVANKDSVSVIDGDNYTNIKRISMSGQPIQMVER